MAEDTLKPRWGQLLTGIVSLVCCTCTAWIVWFICSDPRGPVGWFPYPFAMYLAMMILVGLWQHMLLGDRSFEKLGQPLCGMIQTIVNLIVVCFVIDILLYRVLGVGFNFPGSYGLKAAKGTSELQRFLWLHSAGIAGCSSMPFLVRHHYKVDSRGSVAFRANGVLPPRSSTASFTTPTSAIGPWAVTT